MIHIENKKDCCGCEACVQKCPKHCIAFKQDKEGFFTRRLTLKNV